MTGSNRFAESARIRRAVPTDVTLEVAQMAHVQIEAVARLVRRVPLAILTVGCLLEDVPVPEGVKAIWVSLEIRLVLELVAEQRPILDKDGSRRSRRRYNLYRWRWACRCCSLVGDGSGLSLGVDLGEELRDCLFQVSRGSCMEEVSGAGFCSFPMPFNSCFKALLSPDEALAFVANLLEFKKVFLQVGNSSSLVSVLCEVEQEAGVVLASFLHDNVKDFVGLGFLEK